MKLFIVALLATISYAQTEWRKFVAANGEGSCVGEVDDMHKQCGELKDKTSCESEGISVFSDGVCDWIINCISEDALNYNPEAVGYNDCDFGDACAFFESHTIIDVRNHEDFNYESFNCALNFPRNDIVKSIHELNAMLKAVGSYDAPLAVYSYVGGLSGEAIDELLAAGFTNLVNIGGYDGIKEQGCTCPASRAGLEIGDCDACVAEFTSKNGCDCMRDEDCDVDALVPKGCDQCGDAAAGECGIDNGNYCTTGVIGVGDPDICCDSTCDFCGGAGCDGLIGSCCGSPITDSGVICSHPTETACVIPDPCKPWCSSEKMSDRTWSQKCGFEQCTGCSECDDPANIPNKTCRPWCSRKSPDWSKKCNWISCQSCAECT